MNGTTEPAPPAAAAYVAPRTPVEAAIGEIWTELLGVPRPGVHDRFTELGGNSFLAMQLALRMEQAFGQLPALDVPFSEWTVERMALGAGRPASAPDDAGARVVAIRGPGPRPPLFCVHAVDGHVLPYGPLAHRLGADQPVYGLMARGLDGPGEPPGSVEALAEEYVDAVRRVQPDGPYRLGGWSLGGLVAWEMARRLEAEGREVELLALFDTRIGGATDPAKSDDAAFLVAILLTAFLRQVPGYVFDGPALSRAEAELRGLGQDAQAALVVAEARRAGAVVPDSFDGAHLRRMLAVRKALTRAHFEYDPEPFAGRLTYFQAVEWPKHGREDQVPRWRSLARGGMEVRTVPGCHATMIREPNVGFLAGELRACMDLAAPGSAHATTLNDGQVP